MEQIGPMDKVKVVRANAGQESFLNQIGQVVIIVDEDQYLVRFPDGKSAAFGLEQLKKAS